MSREIRQLIEWMDEELEGAECYAKAAVGMKADMPARAKTLADMAQAELGHYDKLHGMVVEEIAAYRKESGEPPAGMLAVYDWKHADLIDHMAKVKSLIEMAR